MTARLVILVIALSVGASADVRAQHEGHQTPSLALAPAAPAAGCAQGASKALAIVEAANAELEAEQRATTVTNGDMVSRMQTAVGAAQAELFICRAALSTAKVAAMPPGAMGEMDHSKMDMGKPAAAAQSAKPEAKGADPMAGMDHSKMDMGKPAAAAQSAKPAAKGADPMAGMDHSKMDMGKPTAASQSARPAAKAADPMPGMDHSKMTTGRVTARRSGASPAAGSAGKLPVAMAERIADPACPGNVGKAGAARAVYERKVYYFCSTGARDEFRRDPGGYLKKHPR